MSERCHICGPVKHEAPTVICAPCALADAGQRKAPMSDTRGFLVALGKALLGPSYEPRAPR